MALCIEPMLTLGKSSTRILADDWTVVTKDGTRAAHVEHSIAICEDGISVLTAPDRGRAELAPSASPRWTSSPELDWSGDGGRASGRSSLRRSYAEPTLPARDPADSMT